MKTLKLIVFAIVLSFASAVQAQVSVSINLSPPAWGPVGYNEARYYYLPDVEAYYDVQSSMYIYYTGGSWVHRTYLPNRYRNYDLYGGYKVVMTDYRGNTPYDHFRDHKKQYRKGYHGEAQRTIGERPGRGNSGVRNSHNRNRGNQGVHQSHNRVKESNKGDNRNNGKNVRQRSDRGPSTGNNNSQRKNRGGEKGKKR